jgi:hypothetical protein
MTCHRRVDLMSGLTQLDGQWLTYRELGVGSASVLRRLGDGRSGQWSRQPGDDGATRVRVPDDYFKALHPDGATDVSPDAKPPAPDSSSLVTGLEGHIETLKAQLRIEADRFDVAEATRGSGHRRIWQTDRALKALAEQRPPMVAAAG